MAKLLLKYTSLALALFVSVSSHARTVIWNADHDEGGVHLDFLTEENYDWLKANFPGIYKKPKHEHRREFPYLPSFFFGIHGGELSVSSIYYDVTGNSSSSLSPFEERKMKTQLIELGEQARNLVKSSALEIDRVTIQNLVTDDYFDKYYYDFDNQSYTHPRFFIPLSNVRLTLFEQGSKGNIHLQIPMPESIAEQLYHARNQIRLSYDLTDVTFTTHHPNKYYQYEHAVDRYRFIANNVDNIVVEFIDPETKAVLYEVRNVQYEIK